MKKDRLLNKMFRLKLSFYSLVTLLALTTSCTALQSGLKIENSPSPILVDPSLAQSPSEPTQSKYFTTFGGGVLLDPKNQPVKINYALTLQLRQNIPSGAVAIADFENPANIDKPLRATHVFTSTKNRITLISPHLSCVTNGRNYRVLVTLYSDAKRTRILGTHEQLLNFTLPPAQLQQLDIRQCQK